jgi:hypothetical protein
LGRPRLMYVSAKAQLRHIAPLFTHKTSIRE